MEASAPPVITASAYPWRTRRIASPMALEPEAQAVTAGIAGPRQSWRIAIRPDAIFPIIIGTNSGETRRGPFSISLVCSVSNVPIPPIPVPKSTAKRSGSTVPFTPLSSTACCDAATANWAKRSVRSTSFTSRYSFGSKPLTSAPSFALKLSVLKCVMGAMPFLPLFIFCQVSAVLFPNGVTAPIPVTTTRLF